MDGQTGVRALHRILAFEAGVLLAATLAGFTGVCAAAAELIDADKLISVDCLLPGQVRKLGGRESYLGPRRPMRLSANECEIRGGEYVSYDRANYATALHVWQPQAELGDAQAQVYVGEIYEKGMGLPPDYQRAAEWYEKAAKQGNVQGLIHIAYLYGQGLGVAKDPARSLNLYKQAAGLKGDDLTYVSELNAVRDAAQVKIDSLTADLDSRDRAAGELAQQLAETRRELGEQQGRVSQLKREAGELRGKVAQLQANPANSQELDRLKSELASRETRIAEQSATIETLTHTSSVEDEALRGKLADAERQDSQLTQQLDATEAKLSLEQSRLIAATAKADALQKYSRDLTAEMQATNAALAAARAQLDQERSARGSADQDRLKSLNSRIAESELVLERQKTVDAALSTKSQNLEAEKHQLQESVAALQRQHAQDTAGISDLRASLALLQSEQFRRKVEQEQTQARLAADEAQIAEDKKALAASASSIGSKDAQVQQLNHALANKEAVLDEQRAQLTALNSTIDRDKASIDGYIRKINDLGTTRGGGEKGPAPVPSNAPKPVELGLGQYFALIIGNSDYAHLPPLKTAAKDARDIQRVLIDRYGFAPEHTRVLVNATRNDMITALWEIMKTLGTHDSLVIYYAGHGALNPATQHSYWLPTDADNGTPANWISDTDVTGWVAETPALHVLIVADSCYSGAMARGSTAQLVSNGTSAAEQKRLHLLAKLASRTVLTSGGVEPVLDSGADGNSIFAREFIDVLNHNTQIIEATSLYLSLADRVHLSAMRVGATIGKTINQSPQIAWLADAGHQAGGEFLFVPVTRPSARSAPRHEWMGERTLARN